MAGFAAIGKILRSIGALCFNSHKIASKAIQNTARNGSIFDLAKSSFSELKKYANKQTPLFESLGKAKNYWNTHSGDTFSWKELLKDSNLGWGDLINGVCVGGTVLDAGKNIYYGISDGHQKDGFWGGLWGGIQQAGISVVRMICGGIGGVLGGISFLRNVPVLKQFANGIGFSLGESFPKNFGGQSKIEEIAEEAAKNIEEKVQNDNEGLNNVNDDLNQTVDTQSAGTQEQSVASNMGNAYSPMYNPFSNPFLQSGLNPSYITDDIMGQQAFGPNFNVKEFQAKLDAQFNPYYAQAGQQLNLKS